MKILVSFWTIAKERNRFFFPQLNVQRFWGTGDPVPKNFSFRADIFVLFQKRNVSDKQ